jgi:hypothetical protein
MGEAKRRRLAGEPDRAERQRLAALAEAEGCMRCGARFAAGLAYFVVRHNGSFENRCADCRFQGGAVPIHMVVYLGPDPWALDDRQWFAAHPGRSWRLREAMKGELDVLWLEYGERAEKHRAVLAEWMAAGGKAGIVVHQIVPGARHRIPIRLVTEDDPDSFTDAGIQTVRGLREWSDAALSLWPDEAALREAIDERMKRRFATVLPFIKKGF